MLKRYVVDKRISLLLLCSLFLSFSFAYMTKNCFSSAMVYIVDEGFMTKFQTGVISSAFWLAYAIMQIVGGVIVDRWHPEHFITIGMIGSGVANLLVYFFYENYIATLIIWSLNAVIQFGVWPAVFKIMSTMLVPEHRKKGLVLAALTSPVGLMSSYVTVLFISKWQYNFLISAIGLWSFSLLWIIIVRSIKAKIVEEHVDESEAIKDKTESHEKINTFTLIISSGLIFAFIISFLRNMINQIKTLVPTMINESYEGLSPSFATVISLVVMLGSVCGPILAGKLSKLFKNEYFAAAVLFASTIPFATITLFIGKISYWFVIIALVFIVTLISASSLFTASLLSMRFNKWGKGATVSGTINAFAAFGNVGSNFIMTLIAEKAGWLTTLKFSLLSTVVALVCAIIAFVIWKKFIKKNFN